MKTILVLGTNAGQADLIRYMKAQGWRVISCAHQQGGPGEALSDQFFPVNIIDVDAVAKLAQDVNADLIYSISSDLAMTTAVRVSEMLNKPHFYDSNLIDLFNKKHRLRDHLNRAGLSTVAYREINDPSEIAGWAEFPCIVKPVDAQGQRGVAKVENADDLHAAVEDASRASKIDSRVIVEQFLSGVEISCNLLVRSGEIVIDELSERLVHSGPLMGIPKGHLVPCYNVGAAEQDAARKLAHDIVRSLEIENGCLYFQMKITPHGPKIIEIAPRLDGCHMWHVIRHARKIDFLAETINCLTGEPPATAREIEDPDATYELMFQQTPPGVAFDHADFPVPGDALYHEYRYNDGETVLPVNGRREVVGYYIRRVGPDEAVKYADEAPE